MSEKDLKDANFPRDNEGRVYHLGVKRGEVAPRVLSVGDPRRAQTLAQLLDNPKENHTVSAARGFVIHTGRKNGVPISIIATGMGFPMMDFVVRESRAVVDGPMAFIRFGTCGTPSPTIDVGSLVIASSSFLVRRNPDAFSDKSIPFYSFSKEVPADKEITQILQKELEKVTANTSHKIFVGIGATGDSFYSSQGRTDPNFDDHNSNLVDDMVQNFPELKAIEMETFHLYDLARSTSVPASIRASAVTIVLAQRRSNAFLSKETTHNLEALAGNAVLTALASIHLENAMDDKDCVWNTNSNSK